MEYLKPALERWARFLYAWVIPTSAALAIFGIFSFPATEHWPGISHAQRELAAADIPNIVTFAFTSGLVAVFLKANSPLLFELLGGRRLPVRLRGPMVRRHVALWSQMNHAKLGHSSDTSQSDYSYMAEERLHLYPAFERDVQPTRFGNAMSALTNYGRQRYNLNSQILWGELIATAPKEVREAEEDASSFVEFFVASFAAASVFGGLSVLAGAISWNGTAFLTGLILIMALPIFYHRAVASIEGWLDAVRALVNIGRKTLADAYGLQMPDTLEREKEMWNALNQFVFWGEQGWGVALDQYRTKDADVERTRWPRRAE